MDLRAWGSNKVFPKVRHISQKGDPKAEQLTDDDLDFVVSIAIQNPFHPVIGALELQEAPCYSQS